MKVIKTVKPIQRGITKMESKQGTEKRDVYALVTSQIIAALESGAGNGKWKMPWHTTGLDAFSPINTASRKAYRGINTLCLWTAAQLKGYASGEWGTYNQWLDRKAQVKKGEKSTTVVFWKFGNGLKQDGGSDGSDSPATTSASRLLFTKGYPVFNAGQVEGYSPKVVEPLPVLERIARAETFFESVGASVKHGGNRAYYSPMTDHVQMPHMDAFTDAISYYSTLAHEHTHWTGDPKRCDRQFGKRFGDMAYAAEELVAELGAAFVCASLGLTSEPREDHAQYLGSWLRVLKADNKAIFTAASKAQQAMDFMVKNSAGSVENDGEGEGEEIAA